MGGVNPWAELRAHPELRLEWELLPDGLEALYCPNVDGTATIVLDARLTRRQRNVALRHEEWHHNLGVLGVRRFDERQVDDLVAADLVPLDELAQLVASICDDGSPVMAWEIADAFDVTDEVAERACSLLRRREPA